MKWEILRMVGVTATVAPLPAPLTPAQVDQLERAARQPNYGAQYFTADQILSLIATIRALTPIQSTGGPCD